MTMLFRPEQSLNASIPMDVTESGMTMSVSPVRPSKAFLPILVTESGMTVVLHPTTKVLVLVKTTALQSPRESKVEFPSETSIRANSEHPANASPVA